MEINSLWEAREKAESDLNENLKIIKTLLNESFVNIDSCIDRLESHEKPFGHVTALVLIKARNLGLGCYSLSLDALAQEAGALFRPLIECLELLTYLRMDPARIVEALEDRLPKAGVIAHKNGGKFKGLREYLNTNASHFSLSQFATAHLVDFKAGRLRRVQVHNTNVLKVNLCILLAVMIYIAIEAANCTIVCTDSEDHSLCDKIEDLKRRAFLQFDENLRR